MGIGQTIKNAFVKQPEATVRLVEQRNEARRRARAARDRSPKGEVSTKTFPLGRGLIPPADLWGAYLRVSWVRASVNAIVRTATSRGWGFKGNPASCLRARDILSRPNPQDSGLDIIINVFEDMEIFGRGFWELVREEEGKPDSPVVAVYTLDPVRTKPKQDDNGKIIGYIQTTSKGKKVEFEPWEVVYFPLSTKGSEAQGIAPLQSLLTPVATDIHASNYNLSFFKNNALPSGIISMEGAPSDVIQRNRAYLESEHQGSGNAHKHLLLEGNVKFQDWQKSPKEADFLELRRFIRDEIISVFGVPPAKIGIIETGNIGGGSGASQDKTFKKDTVEPLQGQVAERVNRFFVQIALGFFDCEFFFLPIDLETEKEKAEVEKTRAETKKLEAETVGIYIDKEIINAKEAKDILGLPGEMKAGKVKPVFVIESKGKDTETGYSRAVESFESPARKGISSEKSPDLRALVTIKGSPKPFRSEKWLENSTRFKKMKSRVDDELNRWRRKAVATVRTVGVPKSAVDISKTLTDDVLASVDEEALANILAEEMALGFANGAADGLSEGDFPASSFDPSTVDLAAVTVGAAALAKTAADSISEKIRAEIAAGITAGEGVGTIATRVNDIWNSAVSHSYTAYGKTVTRTYSAKAWSTLTARTETLRMMNQGRWESLKANEVKFVNIQLTLGAEAECIALAEGGPYEISAGEGLLPVHPNCVLPGNKVIASDTVAAYKGSYDGRCVEIRTAGGNRLTVTENHPILTPGGFLAAKHLGQGDYVLSALDGQRMAASINPDNDNAPALIEEIFSALEKSGGVTTRGVKVSPEYLHGDGRYINDDIDVVYTRSLLKRGLISSLLDHMSEEKFRSYYADFLRFASLSSFDLLSFASATASSGGVSSGGKALSLGFGSSRHTNIHSGRSTTRLDTSSQEPTDYSRPTYTELLGQFLNRFATLVKADEIVNIKPLSFSGHVYDLHAFNYELYNCGGVLVKNCRCTLVAAKSDVTPGEKGPQAVLEDFRAQ